MTTPDCSDVPGAWVAEAVERCVTLCRREAPRYALHLRKAHQCRDPLDDLLVLAARREVGLSQRVVRPLPGVTLPVSARVFNALDRADRRALLALLGSPSSALPPPEAADDCPEALAVARGEHLASALGRLVDGTRARESRAARAARKARMRDKTAADRPARATLRERPARNKEPRPPP